MRNLLLGVGILLGIFVLYAFTHLALIEIGQEIVVLHKYISDDETRETRLWIVDGGGYAWLHHGYADTPWIVRLARDPIVTMERGGQRQKYRATPVPEADPQVHPLLRAKYGVADRLVRFWAGNDSQTGLLSGQTCKAIPVRLELLAD